MTVVDTDADADVSSSKGSELMCVRYGRRFMKVKINAATNTAKNRQIEAMPYMAMPPVSLRTFLIILNSGLGVFPGGANPRGVTG